MTGYRTIAVATAVFALGILQSTDFNTYLHSLGLDANGTVTSIIGVIMFALRMLTTTPALTSTTSPGDSK